MIWRGIASLLALFRDPEDDDFRYLPQTQPQTLYCIPFLSRPSDPKVRVIRKQLYCHAIKKEKKRSLEWWR